MNPEKAPAVYIRTNAHNTTLYVGVTSDLHLRAWYHNQPEKQSFVQKYALTKVVWYKLFPSMGEAISEEKRLKAGSRAKKVALIVTMNPEWQDLAATWRVNS